MKKILRHRACIALTILFLIPVPYVQAGDYGSNAPVISGEATVTVRGISGLNDSAKFQEYRDFSNNISSGFQFDVLQENEYFFILTGEAVGEQDQQLNFQSALYGKLTFDIDYTKVPHEYAYNGKTLYSRGSKDTILIDDSIQSALASTPLENIAEQLSAFMEDALSKNIGLRRDNVDMNMELIAFDPFSLSIDFSQQHQDGTKPYGGAFSLANALDFFQPVDYRTTNVKALFEYAQLPYYASMAYSYSHFENDVDTLTFDNPFSADDSPLSPSRGQIDLTPDNHYHDFTLTGSAMNLPCRTRVTASASWGWLRQDDDFPGYTVNSSLVQGAPINTPFDTTDPSNLPVQDADAKVNTANYDFLITSRPHDRVHVKGLFRYIDYDNDTDTIVFPGTVETDNFWLPNDYNNQPTDYEKTKAGLDVGFDLYRRTKLTCGYTFEQTLRNNREVDRQKDNTLSAAIDVGACQWLDLRGQIERTKRDINDYDYMVPAEGGTDPDLIFPYLRQYDQADVTRDRLELMATVYPEDTFAVGTSFIFGKDDFDDSSYGLQEDKHYIWNVDLDYAVTQHSSFYAFYSLERYKGEQKAREWNPFDPNNPYGYESSDWEATTDDLINTIGAGVRWALIPDKLDLDVSYSFSDVNGDIDFSSPVGGPEDANPYNPVNFPTVDDTKLHILNVLLTYLVQENLPVTVGFLWERFDYDDFNTDGFSNVPTDSGDVYNGALLMGTLPEDYNVKMLYTKVTYRF